MNQHFQRGLLLYQQGRHQEAVAELRLQLGQDFQDSQTRAFLALALNELEQYSEATEHAQQAIHVDPEEPLGHYALARVNLSRNRLQEAHAAILEAIRLNPYDAGYFGILAHLELLKSRWREALAAANQGLELDPEHGLCTNLRAQALVNLGDRAAAAATMGEALARRPDNAYTHANQGWAMLHAGNHQQALDHFREALRLDPELEFARAGIVEALKARNILYRWMLAWFLWMSRLTPGVRWALVFGAYFGTRVIRQIANNSPELAPYLWTLLYLYTAFVLLTWLAPSFFNLLLRLDRFGRYALSPDQIRGANVLAVCVLAFAGCLIAYLVTGDELPLLSAVMAAAVALPASAIYVCQSGWPRYTMIAITLGLLASFLLSAGGIFVAVLVDSKALLNTAAQVLQTLPLATIASQFAAMYLTQVSPKK